MIRTSLKKSVKTVRREIDIIFDDYVMHGVFPGSVIRGKVMVNGERTLRKMTALVMEFSGKCIVRLDETKEEEPFYFSSSLLGTKPEDVEVVNLDSTIAYKFVFVLPNDIPPSYSDELRMYGHIKHTAKATAYRMGDINVSDEQIFTVRSQFDLNALPQAAMPVVQETQEEVTWCNWCFCKSGPVSVRLECNRRGFTPGETLLVNATINNLGPGTIKSSSASLIQEIFFQAQHERAFSANLLLIQERGRIAPGCKDQWNNVPFLIPMVYPCNFLPSKLMRMHYVLEFRVIPEQCVVDLLMRVTIVIGTVKYPPSVVQQSISFSLEPPSEDNDAENAPSLQPEQGCGEEHGLKEGKLVTPERRREGWMECKRK